MPYYQNYNQDYKESNIKETKFNQGIAIQIRLNQHWIEYNDVISNQDYPTALIKLQRVFGELCAQISKKIPKTFNEINQEFLKIGELLSVWWKFRGIKYLTIKNQIHRSIFGLELKLKIAQDEVGMGMPDKENEEYTYT